MQLSQLDLPNFQRLKLHFKRHLFIYTGHIFDRCQLVFTGNSYTKSEDHLAFGALGIKAKKIKLYIFRKIVKYIRKKTIYLFEIRKREFPIEQMMTIDSHIYF